jgi:hypothetical protein
MTTLIRKIAKNLTSSLNLFFITTPRSNLNVTEKGTDVTAMLLCYRLTGFKVKARVERFTQFELLSGGPITIGDNEND